MTMLRIEAIDDDESTIFTIEGKLTMPSAIELETCWREARAGRPTRNYVVKLAAVTFIDSESRNLLSRMRDQGVKLVPTGCLMKAIVEQIEAEVIRGQHLRTRPAETP